MYKGEIDDKDKFDIRCIICILVLQNMVQWIFIDHILFFLKIISTVDHGLRKSILQNYFSPYQLLYT